MRDRRPGANIRSLTNSNKGKSSGLRDEANDEESRRRSTSISISRCVLGGVLEPNRLAGRSAGRCRRQCPAGNRLFYYSKNAHRAGAFKLLGGNYFVSPRRRRRRRHGTARPPGQYGSGAAACIRMCRAGPGRASHGADAGPVEALNLDDATEHMAAHRHGPRPPGPRNDRVYYHRLETMA